MVRSGIALIIVLAAPLAAQWVHYPTPGIPRTPDGKPNLTAPVPRTADGKPDLSGLWEKKSDKYYNNIAADLPPGDVKPWADALYQQRKKEYGGNSTETQCLPMGPALSTSPYRETRIIQTQAMIAILSEDLTYRQIYMDGRQLEKAPNPSWMGYSVGHWDGDTLVVESNGFNESTWLDFDGHPHTEALHMTERYRRVDVGHVDLQITLDDPKAYAKPWTVPVELDLIVDKEMLEYTCENEKDRAHMPKPVQAGDPKVTADVLAAYAGLYDVEEDGKKLVVEITVDGNNLIWNHDGEGKQRLDAISETSFSLTGTLIDFVRKGSGPAQQLVITTVEGETKGQRRN